MIEGEKKVYRYQVEREPGKSRQEIEAVLPGVEVALTYDGHGLREVGVDRELTPWELKELEAIVGNIRKAGEA